MPIRELPARPNLEYLKKQARTLLRGALEHESEAVERFRALSIDASRAKLADALHTLAREYGFANWSALKLHVTLATGDPAEALVTSIRAGDAAAVRTVLQKNPSLRSRLNDPLPGFDFDETALLAAVHGQHRAITDALLDAGADVNVRSRWWAGGFGVLDWANPELAEHLIARGARVDIHAAARLGKIDTVRALLAEDPARVHARGGDGQLPLHFAATVEIAALLLDAGAELDALDVDHESTAAQYAITRERLAVARYLVERGAKVDILMAAALGERPLVEKILNEDPETIRVTVTERYFPMQNPRAGGTIYLFGFGVTKSPHTIAFERGHMNVFALLMQRSAPWLRLVQAAEIGDESLAGEILAAHPGLFTKLSNNATQRIIGTTVRNNTRALEMLLEAGWPANTALANGQTPLHYAAWHGNPVAVKALLAKGAPVNVFENEHGGSPLAWAFHGSLHSWERAKGSYPAVVRTLLAAGANMPQTKMPLEATEEVLAVLSEQAVD